ncbi:unnamed protein product [Mycena citricolor]|uniref:Galactose oxidase n=1 Tax=Mycena citricolor TaxID=2018698 RepID=A0AAD2GUH0_9AGAR|nr:unnamed protein product [Mycena citricolor]
MLISDPANSSQSHGPSVAWHTLSAFGQNQLLLFGGLPTPVVPIDTLNDSAVLLDVLNRSAPSFTNETVGWGAEPMRRIHHAAVSSPSGEVYIFGGEKGDDSRIAFPDNYVFDPATSTFSPLPTDSAPPALTGHAAVILANGQVLVFGGLGPNGLLPMNVFYTFDTDTNSWSSQTIGTAAAVPSGRRGFAYVLDGDSIVIHGGCDAVYQTTYSDGWIFNITTQSWTSVPALDSLGPRRDHFAVAYNNQVIFGFGYAQNGPADAALSVFDFSSQTFQPSYTAPPPTATVSATIPFGTSTVTDAPTGTGTKGSGVTGSVTSSVHPSSTLTTGNGGNGGNSGNGGGSNGGGTNGGGTDGRKPDGPGSGSTKSTTRIAIGAVLGVLALVVAAACTVWYLRRERTKRWNEGGVFSPLNDDEAGAPPPALMFDSHRAGDGVIGTMQSWGLRVADMVGAGGVVGTGAVAALKDKQQRRDMLADEDTRDFGGFGWFDERDERSSRRQREASGGSSWSLANVFRPKARRENSAASTMTYGSRLLSRNASLMQGPSEKDPFRDQPLEDVAARTSVQRQMSYHSTYSDPFEDEQGTEAIRLVPRGILSPVTELSSSAASASVSGSSSDQHAPPDSLSRSFSSTSHSTPPLSIGSSASRPRTSSILDMLPPKPDQPMRRSDTWWARFSSKSLLDRRTSQTSAAPAMDFRDPNPLPQRLGFVEEETASVLRERSDGSNTSQAGPGPYRRPGQHGKSMSSIQTQQTADSAALERIGGMNIVMRGSRQSGSTSTRGATDADSWTGGEDEVIMTSPVEMVPASSFNLPPSPPGPQPRPPLSNASSSGSSGTSVADRVKAYERRMSQDVPPATPKRTAHGVNYGFAARPSLFVANPDQQQL